MSTAALAFCMARATLITMSEKTIKNLVIVESPAKAHTIEGYLGKDYTVMASVGHIRSIAKRAKDSVKPIDTAHDFAAIYEIDPDKKKTVAELRKAVRTAKTVWLATDEDREGEAIAWHLCEVLKLDPAKTNRIVFHEITKDAITHAIANPRTVDMSLVHAQQARQILDRLVGFELSPVVWKKVPGGKSAGRVQSPAVRLVVEREREIAKFQPTATFKVAGTLLKGSEEVKVALQQDLPDETAAEKFMQSLEGCTYTVGDVTSTTGTRRPLPPFTTSTLQQDANQRLGMSAKATMSIAQQLYQAGLITYMRTDSVNLSQQAIASAGAYIKSNFGEEYHQVRTFKTKTAGAQEAHEAIRPTDFRRETVDGDARTNKLYNLIRTRALATQMADAKLDRTTATINISDHSEQLTAKGEVVAFPGFLKVYGASKNELLPSLTVGDQLAAQELVAHQTFSRPPARYTEGSLVKRLEELEIGRPSTYATIISTIQTRGYVVKGESDGVEREVTEYVLAGDHVTRRTVTEKTGSDKGKLIPTPSGTVVADFLTNYFNSIVDYDFTAHVEKDLDEIAEDKLDKVQMLRDFYDPFHAKINQSDTIDRSKVAGQRLVGKDPQGREIYARIGRFGPMLLRGDGDTKDAVTFANMPAGATVETVTLEQALKMFELPRTVGTTANGQTITANIGRFGPYIKVGSKFVSIKPLGVFEIDEAKARELWQAKQEAEAARHINTFGNIEILNGRFGPYVTDGTKNAKVPKDVDPKTLTAEQAQELLDKAPAKPARKTATKAKKTTTTKRAAATKAKKATATKRTTTAKAKTTRKTPTSKA